MAEQQVCEFCGAPVEWTPQQVALDAWLANFGGPHCTGLGAQCDACGDKEIALAIAEMEREDARILAEEEDDD